MRQIADGRVVLLVWSLGLATVAAVPGCGSTSDSDKQTGGSDPGGSSSVKGSGGKGGVSGSSGSSGSLINGSSGDSGAPTDGGHVNDSVGGAAESGSGSGSGAGQGTGGSSGSSNPFGGAGGSGGSSSAAGFGAGAIGGSVGGGEEAGAGGAGGRVGTGGASIGTGGGASCLEGAPCTCKNLVGVTRCTDGEGSCDCPPANQCTIEAPEPCFEPCGGEPFGTWVLDDACLAGTEVGGDCSGGILKGESRTENLRLRILDGGQLDLSGEESWDISATAPLSCLGIGTVNDCTRAYLFTNALIFSQSEATPCQANACGVCDCKGTLESGIFFDYSSWSREGNVLRLGTIAVKYCVKGDELWVGGTASKTTNVSYKFKKQSCTGEPLRCEDRTLEQCKLSRDCFVGRCAPKAGTSPRCAPALTESDCTVLEGCGWDPGACTGTAADRCSLDTCGALPGCTWGPPKASCGGNVVACPDRPLEACNTPGCTVRVCGPNFADTSDCQLLSATECPKAVGCVLSGSICTGQAVCAAQTDKAICGKLINCGPFSYCDGIATRTCSELSTDDCSNEFGCRIEW